MSKSNYLFAAFYLSSAIFLSGCSNAVTSSGEPVSPITTKQTRDTLEQTKMIENGAIEKNQENLYGIQKKPGEHAFSTTFRRRVRYLEGNNLEIPIPDGYKLEGCTINYIIVTASQCELWVAPTYVNTEYVLVDEVYNPDIDDYECNQAGRVITESVSPITTEQTHDVLEQTEIIENDAIEKNQENLYGIPKKPGEHAFSTTFRRRAHGSEGNNLEIPIQAGYKLVGCTINYITVTASQCELWVAPTYVNTEYVLVDEVYNPDIDDYECNQAGRVITEDEFNRRYEELNGYAPTKTLTSNPNLITIN